MIINISAGHTKTGGAVAYLNESNEARRVTSLLCEYLSRNKHLEVHDCTDNESSTQQQNLSVLARNHKKNKASFNLTIHFNAYTVETVEDYKLKGSEAWTRPDAPESIKLLAHDMIDNLNGLGFPKRNPRVKNATNLYFLNNVENAILLEVCFVDDKDDANLYLDLDAPRVARSIYYAICDWAGLPKL